MAEFSNSNITIVVMIAQPKQKTASNNKVRTKYRVMVLFLNLLA